MYGGPAPSTTVPPIPHLPQGWQALWDPQGQKWAYLESWNSKVSWVIPTAPSLGGHGEDGSRALGGESAGYYGGQNGGHDAHGYNGQNGYGAHGGGYGDSHNGNGHDESGKDKDKSKDKKSDDKKNLAMGVAAGVAVGAVGGVLVASALGTLPFSASSRFLFSTY